MKVGFISLGCSKNLVDTEVMIGKFKNHNFSIVNTPEEADMIIVNTCGFIESAKEEAINTILEMAEYKNKRCKFLIVTGCLVQRYYNDLVKSLPEVDLFLKIEDYDKLWDKVEELMEKEEFPQKDLVLNKEISTKRTDTKQGNSLKKNRPQIGKLPMFQKQEYFNRTISTGENYAYLKIGEGCSNMCTYCAIPYIRGLFVSRPMEEILQEAETLTQQGIKEIIVIAQDTTKYGMDLYGKPRLAELLQKISEIDGVEWVRFLYSYPEGITKELIQTVKQNEKICHYFDIPIQHITNEILKKMNRKTTKEQIKNLIQEIRKQIPDVTIRTSLIVGFPGETKENFEELYQFVEETKFDKLGVFAYSKEDNTPAANMPNQIHYQTKKARERKIMGLQKGISRVKLEEKLGKLEKILVENSSFDGKYLIGRTSSDVPEEDGIVYIKRNKENENVINHFITCKIVAVSDYDLMAESL